MTHDNRRVADMEYDEIMEMLDRVDERKEQLEQTADEAREKDPVLDVWTGHAGNERLGYWRTLTIHYEPPKDHGTAAPVKMLRWAHENGLTLTAHYTDHEDENWIAAFAVADELFKEDT